MRFAFRQYYGSRLYAPAAYFVIDSAAATNRLGIEDLANCSGEVLAAEQLLDLVRVGPLGIDAATRIVGFFVSALGVGLISQGVIEAFRDYGMLAAH
jgi:hypothetical protein